MKKRSQAAMEFLMTYGWAILVVLVAIGALAYMGVTKTGRFLPEKCLIEPGIACTDFKVDEDSVTLVLKNVLGKNMEITDISVEQCTGTDSGALENDEQGIFVVSGCGNIVDEKFTGEVAITYSLDGGLPRKKGGNIVGKVQAGVSDGGDGEGSEAPLDEEASQLTATLDDLSNEDLYPDWHGAKGNDDNIILKLFSDVSYDIYLESFTLSWDDSDNEFEHFQHLTEANVWHKEKIYGNVEESSPVSGVFDDKGDADANLKIPANEYTIIDDLHFDDDIEFPTEFTLVLNFNDTSSSTLTFTIS